MEETRKSKPYNLVAAILFGVVVLLQLLCLGAGIGVGELFEEIITLVGYILVIVGLLSKNNKKLSVIGFILLTVTEIIFFKTIDVVFSGITIFVLLAWLQQLTAFVAYIGITFISIVSFTNYLYKYKDKVKKIWYVPCVCQIGTLIISILINNRIRICDANSDIFIKAFSINFVYIIMIIIAVALLFTGLWMVFPNGRLKKHTRAINSNSNIINEADGYFSMVSHILLLLFTCGIWYYIWIYKTTNYLNCARDEVPRGAVSQLLLCMFVPFYSIYWVYKSAQRIDKLAEDKGIKSDITTICLIFAIFIGILAPVFMQDKINAIVTTNKDEN